MSTKSNAVPFLRVQRLFPQEPQALSVEVDRMYTDIANAVNGRTLGFFSVNTPNANGESWFLTSQRQEALRQIYRFTAAGSIPHGINTAQIGTFVKIYGTFTDGTNWYPLPYVNATAANNQISLTVTSSNIVITAGGGTPPTISSGIVVLEWITQT